MAYVFGFDKDVTRLISSFLDFKYENVIQKGGTPSCLAFKSYRVDNCGIEPGYWEGAYFIMVGVNSRESNNTIFVEHTMVGRGAALILGRSDVQTKSIRLLILFTGHKFALFRF